MMNVGFYINYRDESGKPVKVLVGKKTASSDFTARDAYSKLIEVKYKLQHNEDPTIRGSRVTKIKFDTLWQEFYKYALANKKSHQMDKSSFHHTISKIKIIYFITKNNS